jgi:hypothetical protein
VAAAAPAAPLDGQCRILRLLGAQPPNSDANSRLEADGSGLPARTTDDAGAGAAAEAVEAEVNSVRGVVAGPVNSWRRAR